MHTLTLAPFGTRGQTPQSRLSQDCCAPRESVSAEVLPPTRGVRPVTAPAGARGTCGRSWRPRC